MRSPRHRAHPLWADRARKSSDAETTADAAVEAAATAEAVASADAARAADAEEAKAAEAVAATQAAKAAEAAKAVAAAKAAMVAKATSEARAAADRKVLAAAAARDAGLISKSTFPAWPLTVDSGVLGCKGSGGVGRVTIVVDGKSFAVNGSAKADKDNLDIQPIWADSETAGLKKDMGPLIDEGLRLCK